MTPVTMPAGTSVVVPPSEWLEGVSWARRRDDTIRYSFWVPTWREWLSMLVRPVRITVVAPEPSRLAVDTED